ncbi:hypothetical protein [Variovorax sp. HJSM1_2]|uniref:hypothetical protein n=1 Tax=Variovorax sp. HJSM1_2 TaxID=3366263 RepID=UPI003BD7E290
MADISVSSDYRQVAASTQPAPVSEDVARQRRREFEADSEPKSISDWQSGVPPKPVVNSQGQTIGSIVNTTA